MKQNIAAIQKYFSIYFISFLFIYSNAYCQSVDKQIERGERYIQELSFIKAIDLYRELLTKESQLNKEELLRVKLNLADSYYKIKQNKSAERLYSEVYNSKTEFSEREINSMQRYAQVLSSVGKYEEAGKVWKKYTSLQAEDQRGLEYIKLYKNIDALTRNASSYKVEYVGINSSNPDFSPTYYKNGLVFVSGREKNSLIKRVFGWDNTNFLDLYYLDDIRKLKNAGNNASLSSGNREGDKKYNNSGVKSNRPPGNYNSPNDVNTLKYNQSYLLDDGKEYVEDSQLEVSEFSKTLNSKYHEGPCTFFKNGKKIIFTRNATLLPTGIFSKNKNATNKLKLFSAEFKGNTWTNIKPLDFNSEMYSCGHPAMNQHDNILYFVSDMPGGYGGTDIYMSRYESGRWTKPVNMGNTVNTVGNEMFPFVDENGGLYFSSDGWPGLGELDIFYIKTDINRGDSKGLAHNLGAPLNSIKDDFGILTDAERKAGYISSNRKRGGADDDIYMFTRLGELYGCKDLIVSVLDDKTKTPVQNAEIEYRANDINAENANTNDEGIANLCLNANNTFEFKITKRGYKTQKATFSNDETSDFETSKLIINLKKEETIATKPIVYEATKKELYATKNNKSPNVFKGQILAGQNGEPISGVMVKFINKCNNEIQEQITDADGNYYFERKPDCDYDLVASKPLYGTSMELINKLVRKNIFGKTVKAKKATVVLNLFDTKMFKVGDVIKFENIYHDLESYKLNDYIKNELNKMVKILNRYPKMIIEVSSHTDTRGNAYNNLHLSQMRANQVLKYLTKNGIASNRIRAIGKGESEPLNKCGDGVQCTEAEHQRNRRTEIKILTIERK